MGRVFGLKVGWALSVGLLLARWVGRWMGRWCCEWLVFPLWRLGEGWRVSGGELRLFGPIAEFSYCSVMLLGEILSFKTV